MFHALEGTDFHNEAFLDDFANPLSSVRAPLATVDRLRPVRSSFSWSASGWWSSSSSDSSFVPRHEESTWSACSVPSQGLLCSTPWSLSGSSSADHHLLKRHDVSQVLHRRTNFFVDKSVDGMNGPMPSFDVLLRERAKEGTGTAEGETKSETTSAVKQDPEYLKKSPYYSADDYSYSPPELARETPHFDLPIDPPPVEPYVPTPKPPGGKLTPEDEEAANAKAAEADVGAGGGAAGGPTNGGPIKLLDPKTKEQMAKELSENAGGVGDQSDSNLIDEDSLYEGTELDPRDEDAGLADAGVKKPETEEKPVNRTVVVTR